MVCHACKGIIRTIIQVLSPYIEPIKQQNKDFPNGYCDVVVAQVFFVYMVPGTGYKCGIVEGKNHVWLTYCGFNIDFTAGQFKTLRPHTVKVSGFEVLIGSDDFFRSLGIDNHPAPGMFRLQLAEAAYYLTSGLFGSCNPGSSQVHNLK